MATEALYDRRKLQDAARKICDEASERAKKVYIEAKKQADIVYEKAQKLVVDDQTRKEAAKAYEEAVKQAEEARHKIEWQAQVVFTAAWVESDTDYQEALTKAKEHIDLVRRAYDEAKKQAEIVYEEAKKLAVGKQAKEAAKAYKKAIQQAEKDYHEGVASIMGKGFAKTNRL
jgi:hypothetical protein